MGAGEEGKEAEGMTTEWGLVGGAGVGEGGEEGGEGGGGEGYGEGVKLGGGHGFGVAVGELDEALVDAELEKVVGRRRRH